VGSDDEHSCDEHSCDEHSCDEQNYSKFMYDSAINEITKRLHTYKLDKLPNMLVENDAIIAGSFPLQCVLKQQWNEKPNPNINGRYFNGDEPTTYGYTDIDVFTRQENAAAFHEYLAEFASAACNNENTGHGYENCNITKITTYWVDFRDDNNGNDNDDDNGNDSGNDSGDDNGNDSGNDNGNDSGDDSGDNSDNNYTIHNYINNNEEYPFRVGGVRWVPGVSDIPQYVLQNCIMVQIIELPNDTSPRENILNTFDIDICKITYTGSSILYQGLVEKAHRYKATFDSNKNATGSEIACELKDRSRVRKYEARGFTITRGEHDNSLTAAIMKAARKT